MESGADFPSDVYLEVTKKSGEVSRFAITKKTVTIGRDPGCDLRLDDPYVSRKHCQVVFRGDHFTVMDLGSLNKTVVKGKRYIQKNLMPGNVLTLGETQLTFLWDGSVQWRREHAGAEDLMEGDQLYEGPEPPGAPPQGPQAGGTDQA
jgi:pSer/pThr/pTyr-binding forkhead associated (FHA) protein